MSESSILTAIPATLRARLVRRLIRPVARLRDRRARREADRLAALHARAVAHATRGEAAAAADVLARIALLAPDDADLWNGLAAALADGLPDAALDALRRAATLRPTREGLQECARRLLDRGRGGDAAAVLGGLAAIDRAAPPPEELIGQLHLAAGRTAAAFASYAAAAASHPRRVEPLVGMGRACLHDGLGAKALAFYRRALAIDPTHARALVGLAAAQRGPGATEAAIAAWRRAVVQTPWADNHLQLAALLIAQGDAAGAIEHADAALGRDPANVRGLMLRAHAAFALGRTAEAAGGFRAILAAEPGRDAAREGLSRLACADALAVRPGPRTATAADGVAVAVGAGIGNMIQCTPAIRRLSEHMGAPVDVLLNEDFPGCATLFEGAPWVGRVHAGFAAATAVPYRLVVVLDSYGPLHPPFDAVRVVAGPEGTRYSHARDRHEAEYHLETLRSALGVPYRPADVSRYFVGGFDRGTPVPRRVGLHAGCKPGIWDAKRWPGFAALAAALVGRGYEVVSFGGPGEHVPGTVDATGTDLATTIEAMRGCAYVVANDSGLMHVADALGIPTTTIFAPTSIVKNGPLAETSRVVAIARDCAPCQFDRARLATCRCIRDIGLDTVLAAVLGHLAELAGERPAAAVPETDSTLIALRLKRWVDQGRAADAREPALRLLATPAASFGDGGLRALVAVVRALGLQSALVAAVAPAAGEVAARQPAQAADLLECAALVLSPDDLDAFAAACADGLATTKAAEPVGRFLDVARRYCSPPGLLAVLQRIDATQHARLLQRIRAAQDVGDALLGAPAGAFRLPGSGMMAADFVANASAARRVPAALAAGDRAGFVAAAGEMLAAGRGGARALALLLRNATCEVAALGLGPGAIEYPEAEPPDDVAALAIILEDAPAVAARVADGPLLAAWRTRSGDYAPLNVLLAEWLAPYGGRPPRLDGPGQAAVLAACLGAEGLDAAPDAGLVSIVMAAHDPDPVLLPLAVRSVLAQTYRNLELIVVDDGSAPAGAAALAALGAMDRRVRTVRNPVNAGPYHCRNLALASAGGAFVGFHDADDVAHPQRLALQIAALLADDRRVLGFAAHMRFDAAGALQFEPAGDGLSILGDGPVTAICRRAVFDRVGAFAPVRSRGDTEMRARIAAAYGEAAIHRIEAPLLFCAGGPASLSAGTASRHPEAVALFRRSFQQRVVPPALRPGAAWPPAVDIDVPYPLRASVPR